MNSAGLNGQGQTAIITHHTLCLIKQATACKLGCRDGSRGGSIQTHLFFRRLILHSELLVQGNTKVQGSRLLCKFTQLQFEINNYRQSHIRKPNIQFCYKPSHMTIVMGGNHWN